MKILGISRSPRFSPNSEDRDRAIFQAVTEALRREGHAVETVGEDGYRSAESYDAAYSMARGVETLRRLAAEEERGLPVVNSARALLGASRSALTASLEEAGIPVPRTLLPPFLPAFRGGRLAYPAWLKRSDACAQSQGDVCFLRDEADLEKALGDFSRRRITEAVVCEHVKGDLLKFYGVEGSGFFYYYYPTAEGAFSKFGLEKINGRPEKFPFPSVELRHCADRAARVSGLTVYGGDCIVRPDGSFCLIDFNDWPSFSPCAAEAAEAIAGAVQAAAVPVCVGRGLSEEILA